ncbi:unnamed protein product [Spodoptera exigua]|nr:unnamed protein product [Spodoptera exigua]
MLAGQEASIELVQRWLQRRGSDDTDTGSSSGSPGARAGRRSSLALTPEDEPLVDVATRNNNLWITQRVVPCGNRTRETLRDRQLLSHRANLAV